MLVELRRTLLDLADCLVVDGLQLLLESESVVKFVWNALFDGYSTELGLRGVSVQLGRGLIVKNPMAIRTTIILD